ncbi:MAG: hypothetical protein E7265_06750 [Lachnospiraceae bacterium]|nr:hypothetical protein [Lachnospiraceae bacterium]
MTITCLECGTVHSLNEKNKLFTSCKCGAKLSTDITTQLSDWLNTADEINTLITKRNTEGICDRFVIN